MIGKNTKFDLLPALLIAGAAFGGGVVVDYAPPATGQMAVVFPFGTTEAQALGAIIAAGGRYVGPTRLDNIAVAVASDTGFAGRIRAAGAWLTLAAQGLCSPNRPQPRAI